MGNQQKKLSTLFSPSRTALYCTISAPLKSKDAYNSASNLYTNVVGYQTQGTASSGFAMKAASFETVGAVDGSATLADLKITGYDPYDEVEDEGGTSGQFSIQFLNASGKTTATYQWFDDDVTTGWKSAGSVVDASTVKLPAAGAVWTKGAGLSITSSGAVSDADIVKNFDSAGFAAVGNTTPVAVTLADLAVTGYDPYDEVEDEGGTSGQFSIQFLDANGRTTATYQWFDDDVTTGWKSGGVVVDATSVTIPAGTGVWVKGAGLTLTIPSPIPAP